MTVTSDYTILEGSVPNHSTATWLMLRRITGVAQPETQIQGFSLLLGDGSRWWIAGLPPALKLVEELATIMQLQPDKPRDASIIVFIEGKAPPERVKQLLAMDPNWFTYSSNHVNRWFRKDSSDLLCELSTSRSKIEDYVTLWDGLQFIHRQKVKGGGLPFHAALVEYQGQGVILAAAGATGKSTCCNRLPPFWRPRCDDEVLVILTTDGRYLTHPFPTWSDYFYQRRKKTWKVTDYAPLAGIFFIEQSSSDECFSLSPSEAVARVTFSAQQVLNRFLSYCGHEEARNIRRSIFRNAGELVKKIPTFGLKVSLTGRFWEKIEDALGWR
jgi:SynChlorMet cassette protein ScmC